MVTGKQRVNVDQIIPLSQRTGADAEEEDSAKSKHIFGPVQKK
jgi:hypothetical protein